MELRQFRLAGPSDAEDTAALHTDDSTWGALLENLHVLYARKRRGIGTQLLALTAAQAATERTSSPGLYLWILEQNTNAQAFDRAHGGTSVGSRQVSPPGGESTRLNDSPVAQRFVWPDPHALARQCRVEQRASIRAWGRSWQAPSPTGPTAFPPVASSVVLLVVAIVVALVQRTTHLTRP